MGGRRSRAAAGPAVSAEDMAGRWLRAPEFDTPEGRAYMRDRGARSRPRQSMELRKDGDFIETKIGASDRPSSGRARWTLSGDTLCIYDSTSETPSRTLEIVATTSDRLIVRESAGEAATCRTPPKSQ
jgi:hypothetical protein